MERYFPSSYPSHYTRISRNGRRRDDNAGNAQTGRKSGSGSKSIDEQRIKCMCVMVISFLVSLMISIGMRRVADIPSDYFIRNMDFQRSGSEIWYIPMDLSNRISSWLGKLVLGRSDPERDMRGGNGSGVNLSDSSLFTPYIDFTMHLHGYTILCTAGAFTPKR